MKLGRSIGPGTLVAVCVACAGGGAESPAPPAVESVSAPAASSAESAVVPFPATGAFHVMDTKCSCILRVDGPGAVSVAVSADEIRAVTRSKTVSFGHCAIAFDRSGTMYFTEAESDSILQLSPAGTLSRLVSAEQFMAFTGMGTADPEGLTFGADGSLYVLEEDAGRILGVDPASGELSVLVAIEQIVEQTRIADIEFGSHIVGGRDGAVYFTTRGDPPGILAAAPGPSVSVLIRGAALGEIDGFLTSDLEGNLVLINGVNDVIRRISTGGEVTTLLPQAELEQMFGREVRLAGGGAFDSEGNLFLTEDNSKSIARIDPQLRGELWVEQPAANAVTGNAPDYRAGAAFAPRR